MTGRLRISRAMILFTACMVAGCASIGSTGVPEKSPVSPKLHVWLLPSCPSAFDHPHGVMSGVTNLLLVKPEKAIVHTFLEALTSEEHVAKVMQGTSSGYLWWSDPEAAPGVASCIVLAASESDPATWCDPPHSPFSEARNGAICKYFRSAEASAVAAAFSSVKWQGSGLPLFYAEILLQPAKGEGGVVPKGALYYYPTAFRSGKSGGRDGRSLLITVSATTAAGNEPALEDVVLPLIDIRPANELAPVLELPAVSIARPSKVRFIRGDQPTQADHGLMSVDTTASIFESDKSEAVSQLAAAIIHPPH